MPIIDGKIRNPDRHRYYGLDVGDRVEERFPYKPETIKRGTVVELAAMDNNRVYVLWDGKTEVSRDGYVAEWLKRIT